MSVLVFFRKSYVKAHQRRLKSGQVITIPAHYDKRTKKGADAPLAHGHDLRHLDEAKRAVFEKMHAEQHLLHHYHAHALRQRVQEQAGHLEGLAQEVAGHRAAGRHVEAAKTENQRLRLYSRHRVNQRELDDIEQRLAGLAGMKEALVQGSGAIDASTEDSHRAYTAKLGGRFKARAKPEPKPATKPFTPTHALPDGTPVRATGEKGVYTDASGAEIEDDYAKPVKAARQEHVKPAAKEAPKPTPQLSSWDRDTLVTWVADGKPTLGLHQKRKDVWDTLSSRDQADIEARAERELQVRSDIVKQGEAANQKEEALYQSVKTKLLAGNELTDAEIEGLGLRVKGAAFAYLSPAVQRLFGISKMKVREVMGDALKPSYSDFGAKTWVANPRKALANAAAWVNKASGPQEGDTKSENGIDYVLKDGRWHRTTPEAKTPTKPKTKPNPTHYRVNITSPFGEFQVYVAADKDAIPSDYLKDAKTAFLHDSGGGTGFTSSAQVKVVGDPVPVTEVPAEASAAKNAEWARIAKVVKPAAPVAPETPTDDLDPSSPNYRYRDTGYVGGSRKELAAAMLRTAKRDGRQVRKNDIDWETLETNPREAKEVITKSHLFGTIDWEGLKAQGLTPGAGFVLDRVYASVGTGPRDDTPQARQDYALGLETLRNRLEVCRTPEEIEKTLAELKEERDGVNLNSEETARFQELEKQAEAAYAPVHEYTKQEYQHEKAVSIAHRVYYAAQSPAGHRRGSKYTPEQEADIQLALASLEAAKNAQNAFTAAHPDMRRVPHEIRTAMGISTTFERPAETEWRRIRQQQDVVVALAKARNQVESPMLRAWSQLGERFNAVLDYRSGRGSDTFHNHLATAKLGRIKDWSWQKTGGTKAPRQVTEEGKRFQLQVSDSHERVGGRSVAVASTADLKERFGLREVQSGNWVLRDPVSAKFHVEQTAGALADLADILGITDQQVAMNGRVALAFGARGTGNAGGMAARAHYEPVQRVIALTKMGGGGCLAHEWLHGLDNLLLESQGGDAKADDFLTEDPSLLPPGPLRNAFQGLRDAFTTGQHRIKQRLIYTPEHYRLAQQNIARTHMPEAMREYGLPNAARIIKEARDASMALDKLEILYEPLIARGQRGAKKHLEDWRNVALAYHGGQPEGGSLVVETGKPQSSFAMEAQKLDNGAIGKYWSKPHEMAARAFQSYVEDKLASQGRRNDYLSAKADNKYYRMDGTSPFPEGEERTRINAAFDKLIAAMQADNSLAKALAKTATPRVLLVKSRGWWGPEHGGNHLKKLDALHGASVTSDLPSGGHTLPTLPSSVGIQDAVAARDYWQRHLANQTFTMSVAMKSGKYPMSLSFDSANTHMWTRAASPEESADAFDRPREKVGPRVFDAQRALLMDRLIPSLERPWKVLASHDRNLFLGARLPDGKTYVVVLRVVSRGVSHFVSAHPRDQAGINKLITALRPVVPAGHASGKKKPLRKAAVDLVSLNRLDEIVGFRDSQVASLTGSALAEPHCRALQAPARAIAANQGNLEPKSKPLTGLPASVSADPDENIAVKPSLRKSWVVVFPNGLAKSYVHGHYRKNPKTGEMVWVESFSDKRTTKQGMTLFAHDLHRQDHFKQNLAEGRLREAMHSFHDLDHDAAHKLAGTLGLHNGDKHADKMEIENPPSALARANPDGTGIRPLAGFNKKIVEMLATVNREKVSGVVDANGEPLIAYHGTGADISGFDDQGKSTQGEGLGTGLGHFFTNSPEYASDYAKMAQGNVIPSWLAIKKPLVITDREGMSAAFRIASDAYGQQHYGKTLYELENSEDDADYRTVKAFYDQHLGATDEGYFGRKNRFVRQQLQAMGYDGIVFKNDRQLGVEGGEVLVAFTAPQVKSAIGNAGTFRPDLAHLSKAWPRTPIFFRNARLH